MGQPQPPLKLNLILMTHLMGGFLKAPTPKALSDVGWDRVRMGLTPFLIKSIFLSVN